jgi:hypothetical protein
VSQPGSFKTTEKLADKDIRKGFSYLSHATAMPSSSNCKLLKLREWLKKIFQRNCRMYEITSRKNKAAEGEGIG